MYWNTFLAIFSICGAIRMLPFMLAFLYYEGKNAALCTSPVVGYGGAGPSALWTCLFIFSKVPELCDTVFVVLNKKPLMFFTLVPPHHGVAVLLAQLLHSGLRGAVLCRHEFHCTCLHVHLLRHPEQIVHWSFESQETYPWVPVKTGYEGSPTRESIFEHCGSFHHLHTNQPNGGWSVCHVRSVSSFERPDKGAVPHLSQQLGLGTHHVHVVFRAICVVRDWQIRLSQKEGGLTGRGLTGQGRLSWVLRRPNLNNLLSNEAQAIVT